MCSPVFKASERCIFVFIGVVVAAVVLSSMAQENANATVELVLKANEDFTTDVYNQLAKNEGNIFFSPISIHALLSMAFQGAQGSTAEKFAATLKVPEAKTASEGYLSILNKLNSVENVTLLMANKAYLMEGKALKDSFKNVLEKQFLSTTEQLNFGNGEEAAATINKWVKEQTKEKIQELIQPSDLNALTRLVLLNAIYFKGDWLHKFNKDKTKDENFYVTKDNPVQVKMMHTKQKLFYKYSQELDSQIVELPYVNKDISMFVILPNEIDGIKNLEAKLAATPFSEVTAQMHKLEVNLKLPRFKIEQTIDLKEVLTALGLGEIFDEGSANFGGIMDEPTYVSKILQKSFIEVNEEGSEAAAVTGMAMMMRSSIGAPRPPPNFIADHPFIFLIAEKPKNVLFAGRISKTPL